MVRTVTWISDIELSCIPTANVILCTNLFTLPAQLTEIYENYCPEEYVYTFTYDTDDLPTDFLADYEALSHTDIVDVLCEDCYTQWVKQTVDKAFEFVVSRGPNDAGDDLTLPSGGPLKLYGGDGIGIQLTAPNGATISTTLSSDANNQIILGSDSNPYVAPPLFSPDGWYTISEFAQWSYASANSITVPSGALNRYAKGDKLKIVQLGTPKYLYVVDVADTLLTVHAGADYTVSNNPIEAAYLSKDLSPVGFPSSFAFTSTVAGFSVLPADLIKRFSLTGRRARIDVYNNGALGTSNSTSFTMTVPFAVESGGPAFISGGNQGYDNGVYQKDVFAQIAAGSSTISLSPDGGTAVWTNSGDKTATFNLEFYI